MTPEIRLFLSLKDIAPKWREQVWRTCLYYFTGAASQSGAICAPKQPDALDQSCTTSQIEGLKLSGSGALRELMHEGSEPVSGEGHQAQGGLRCHTAP